MTEDDSLELDASVRRSLDEARTLLEPPSQRQKELLSQISLSLEAGGPVDVPSPFDGPLASAAHVAPVLPIKVLVVSAITSALIGTAVAYHSWPNSQTVARPSESATTNAPPSPEQESHSKPLDVGEPADRAPSPAVPERAPAPRNADPSVEKAASPEALSSSEELSHVRRAQAALRDGDPALALQLMQSLDDARTSGALLAERGVTRVLALCALGRQSEAEKAARAVRERADGTVYQERLSSSCAKGALAPEPSDERAPPSTLSIEPTKKEPR